MGGPHIHIPFDKIDHYSDFLRRNRPNLEIYFSAHMLDTFSLGEIEKTCNGLSYTPSISIHAPFMDLSPAAVDDRVREATMARFHRIMDMASLLRPIVAVFHSGYDKWKYALATDIWLEKSLITWNEVLRRAGETGTKIAIENIFEDSPDNLRLLADAIDHELFGLCFDTGHFNLFSRVTLEEWIGQTGKRIIELHLHDNDGKSDAHTSIGKGTFDFRTLFSLLADGNDILRTIEAHSPEEVMESISALSRC